MRVTGFRLFAVLFLASAVGVVLDATTTNTLDGIWVSQGYGYIFEIHGSTLTQFEKTTTTCVLADTKQRGRDAQGQVVFRSKQEGKLFIRPGAGPDQQFLYPDDSVVNIRLNRVEKMPPVCQHLTPNTPVDNFQVFTRTFAENYIAFDLRHADWEAISAKFRTQVTARTTPAQLFEIFKAMIEPLGDLHTGLAAPSVRKSTKSFWRSGTDRLLKDSIEQERPKLFALIDKTYLQGRPRLFCRGHLQYGHLSEEVGYLRILSFGGYARHDDPRALESALDAIFSDGALKALVLDLRLTFGGSDVLGVAIARRLTASPYVAYTVQARSDPENRNEWTPGQAVPVEPSARPGFRGPVIELVGPITMSAAETFTQALMDRKPRVVRIGESTQGVFCDTLDRRLPNGWTFSLPNAVYRSSSGEAFDARGIPPDFQVPVFHETDVLARRDPAMMRALALLNANLSQSRSRP